MTVPALAPADPDIATRTDSADADIPRRQRCAVMALRNGEWVNVDPDSVRDEPYRLMQPRNPTSGGAA